jgi:hypothetical protein
MPPPPPPPPSVPPPPPPGPSVSSEIPDTAYYVGGAVISTGTIAWITAPFWFVMKRVQPIPGQLALTWH